MKQSFSNRYDCTLKDEFILASSTFLNTQSFSCLEFDEILASTRKIKDHYSEQLAANGCNIDRLNAEFYSKFSFYSHFIIYFFQMLHQVNVGLAFSNLKKVWASKISSISQKFALTFHCQMLNANV